MHFEVIKFDYVFFPFPPEKGDKLKINIFRSLFSHIRTGYGEIRTISQHSARMRENKDQKNSEYGHFSRSEKIRRI